MAKTLWELLNQKQLLKDPGNARDKFTKETKQTKK